MAEQRDCVEDLKKERAKCSFNTEELTNIINGGKEVTAQIRKIRKLFLDDPAFTDLVPLEYLSHEDLYASELRKSIYLLKKAAECGLDYRDLDVSGVYGLLKNGNPLMIHTVFINTIQALATPQQQQEWMTKIANFQMIGTYAQTELGHGSFVRGLETTATYNPNTEQFVLHSPTLTATKWWPGGLGKSSNTAVVMAQLYTRGQCYGPHLFLVPLRDVQTHRSLPGVTLGEIGPRMGLNANDNGFLKFDHYHIPRTNMLMRFSQVLEDGSYVKPLHSKLSYGSMSQTRVGITFDCARVLMKAATIAVRYSAVRHQSEMVPGEPEPQILDYQTQQYKLLPQVASAFAMLFAARSLSSIHHTATKKLEKGEVDILPEFHSLSSGLKAVSAFDAVSGVDTCRLACGGHGYLASSALPHLYTNIAAAITYEGENTVLLLQVARYLVKSYQAGRKGRSVQSSVSYLAAQPVSSPSPPLSDAALVVAFKHSTSTMVQDTEAKLQQLINLGHEQHQAWNSCLVQLVNCAKAHMRSFICEKFVEAVWEVRASEGVRDVLHQLCRLYLIYHITGDSGAFLRSGALSVEQVQELEQELWRLLGALRHQAVSVVDAFDVPDQLLNSTLGAWDGNVYHRLYNEALKSPLNQSDVPAAYHQHLQPLIKSQL